MCKNASTPDHCYERGVKIRYVTCDVFTERRFGGNPLGVVLDASELNPEQMQQIARELNYSETSFVLPSRSQTRRVRIFTPTREVPFAGHPTIGTAAVLIETGALSVESPIVFEQEAGVVAVHAERRSQGLFCELEAPQSLALGAQPDIAAVAAAVGLSVDDVRVDDHVPVVASVGLPFVLVELQSVEALKAARPIIPALERLREPGVPPDVLVYVHESSCVRCRVFAPLDNIPEDPATGSANCALAGLRAHVAANGDHRFRVFQGVEMGRPSELYSSAHKVDGRVERICVGGFTVMVCDGQMMV